MASGQHCRSGPTVRALNVVGVVVSPGRPLRVSMLAFVFATPVWRPSLETASDCDCQSSLKARVHGSGDAKTQCSSPVLLAKRVARGRSQRFGPTAPRP